MNNLTSTLLAHHSNLEVEEWLKQGQSLEFNSGKNQRIIKSTIPAIELQITYKNINTTQYLALKNAYEANHSNTFIVDADDIHDFRPDVMGLNSSVWVFEEFKFNVKAPKIYNGTIKLLTSVFFNYTEYQSLFSQSSSYSPVISLDTDFKFVLDTATPYQVDYEYLSNSIFSNINASARHIKDKGGLRKKWTLNWFLQQYQFLELLKFYRKKAGIMGVFGIPEEGSIGIIPDFYVQNQDDYIVTDYFTEEVLTNAMFMKDSFKFTKRVDNMYVCKADIVEVLN